MNQTKTRLLMVFLLILLFTVLLTACTTTKGRFDDPALIVNGEEISVGELRTIYATYVPSQPVAKEALLNVVITDVVNYRLILQNARTKGYTASTEEVDVALANFLAQQKMVESEFIKTLNGTGTTIDDYRTRLSEDILVNKVLGELDTNLTETEVASYYAKNIANYMVPETVVVRQITLPLSLNKEELAEKTNVIMQGVQEGKFCEMAEEYSLDPSCNSYGISWGDAFPAFEQAAYNQEIGGITLVQGDDGYYFVETINKLNFNPLPLEQVETTIASSIGAAKFQKAYAAYIAELRDGATIVNNIQ